MTKSVKGTQTEKNLLTSFAGESQARMRYTFFASKAKKEGYEQISAIFTETANQEKEHAERMFKFLEGGMVEINAAYPAGVIGDTLENLKAAAAVNTKNGHWIILTLPKWPSKRVSPLLLPCTATSSLPKRVTKNAIWLS